MSDRPVILRSIERFESGEGFERGIEHGRILGYHFTAGDFGCYGMAEDCANALVAKIRGEGARLRWRVDGRYSYAEIGDLSLAIYRGFGPSGQSEPRYRYTSLTVRGFGSADFRDSAISALQDIHREFTMDIQARLAAHSAAREAQRRGSDQLALFAA